MTGFEVGYAGAMAQGAPFEIAILAQHSPERLTSPNIRSGPIWSPPTTRMSVSSLRMDRMMEIIVVTSHDALERIRTQIEKAKTFDWAAPYNFRLFDYTSFEQTAEYTKLADDKNWLGDYDRAKREIELNHWAFHLREIRFILMHPRAKPERDFNSLVHEVAHMATCEDDIATLIGKQTKRVAKHLRKELKFEDDRGQLFMSAIHVIQFPMEIIADRWVAAKSRELLDQQLAEACSVWSEALKKTDDLAYSLGYVLRCLKQYLAMQDCLSLAQQHDIDDKASAISAIIAEFEKLDQVKLAVERRDLWRLASKLRIAEYIDKSAEVIRRLAKTVPLKSTKATPLPLLGTSEPNRERQATRSGK